MTDEEQVHDFLASQKYMIIAVALSDGTPWATPVKIQRWDKNIFEWDSVVSTDHSRAIELHPDISLALYRPDSETEHQFGFYAKARAARVTEPDNMNRARYRATVSASWINDQSFVKREVWLA